MRSVLGGKWLRPNVGGHPGWTRIKLPTDGLRFLMDRYSEQIVLTQARINGGTLISTVIANLHGYEVCPICMA
ncbi:unnamed protein product [Lasius platythorax]|uniref:Uncharacterized protein n=1 Tax=Lasius platythorax TaxID=488582 RepID=A0AAV2NK20_9HYME